MNNAAAGKVKASPERSASWPHPTKRARRIVYGARGYLRLMYRLGMLKVDVEGLDNIPAETERCVFFGSHHSEIDALLVGAVMPYITPFMAKAEIGKWPFIGQLAHDFGAVLVHRSDQDSKQAAVRAAIEFVEAGRSPFIFAAGRCVPRDEVAQYRHGCTMVAFKTNVPVIPVVLYGTEDVHDLAANIPLKYSRLSLVRKVQKMRQVKKLRQTWLVANVYGRTNLRKQMAIHFGPAFHPENYANYAAMTAAVGEYVDGERARMAAEYAKKRGPIRNLSDNIQRGWDVVLRRNR